MTPDKLILIAMLMQGLLAMILLFVLGRRRLPLVAKGKVHIRDIAMDDRNWPEKAVLASNAFNNQFQLPVLFYVACGISLYLGTGWAEVALAFFFVGSRCFHAAIHVTSNYVPHRFMAYVFGFGILVLWWLLLAVRVIVSLFGA